MTLTYYGHSTFQIVTAEDNGAPTTLLVDPFLTGNPLAEGVATPDGFEPDVVLVTHAHFDHWGDAPSILKRTGALLVSQLEVVNYAAKEVGHTNGHPMNTGGAWRFGWGRLTNTYARHSSSFPDGTYGGLASGFVLESEGKTIYNTGDTCRFAEMAWIGERFDIDLCLMPIGDDFTMGPDEAVEAAKMIGATLTVPLHYNTFPLNRADPDAWAAKMAAAGLGARVLAPGETMTV